MDGLLRGLARERRPSRRRVDPTASGAHPDERDPQLLDDAMAMRVFLTTPTTLIAMLRTISYAAAGHPDRQLCQGLVHRQDRAETAYDGGRRRLTERVEEVSSQSP